MTTLSDLDRLLAEATTNPDAVHDERKCAVCRLEALKPLEEAAPALLASVRLLAEWRRTPFFETRAEWERWVTDFGARVDDALAKLPEGGEGEETA